MAENSLVADLSELVRQAGKVPTDRFIGPETRLVEDLNIDSLDLVAVFLGVQDRFDVVIDDDDVPQLKSIADLAAYVIRNRGTIAA